MIRPRKRSGEGRLRLFATMLTLGLLFGAHAGLKGIQVPAFASGRAAIRELDALILERFATPAPPDAAETENTDAAEEPPEEVLETLPFEQDVASAMEELERRFGLDEEVASPTGVSPGEALGVSTPGITEAASGDRFESLFGAGGEVPVGRAGRGRTSPARDAGGGLGIAVNERVADVTERPTGGSSAVGPDVAVATRTERDEAEGTEVAVTEFESEEFDVSEADRLATWLRANRSELPIGVRVHVNFEPSFLTAAVPMVAEGKRWELFLMFNETLREIHIVLVDGERSVYLIDRGFQEQSRSLREGTVRRAANGQIVAVDSRTAAASSERAREFYSVFLSWWEQAKK